jgi:hypothetical protein
MKKTCKSKGSCDFNDDLRPEYRFDYGKAKPNRFAARAAKAPLVVMLDSDVSKVFRTPDSVNEALRALLEVAKTTARLTRRSTGRARKRRPA